jgi:hypothetical protein
MYGRHCLDDADTLNLSKTAFYVRKSTSWEHPQHIDFVKASNLGEALDKSVNEYAIAF